MLDVFGTPKGNRPLQVSAYKVGVQSVPSGVNTLAQFDAHDYDEGGFHNTAVNNTRLTVPPDGGGIYLFTYYIIWQQFAGVLSLREAFMLKNGVVFGMLYAALNDTTGANFAFNIASLTAQAAAGDYFELYLYQSSGVNQDAGNAARAFANTFTATRLRAA